MPNVTSAQVLLPSLLRRHQIFSGDCEFANSCSIDQGVGNVTSTSNVEFYKGVKPVVSTAYTLTCNGAQGESELITKVNVITTKEINPL